LEKNAKEGDSPVKETNEKHMLIKLNLIRIFFNQVKAKALVIGSNHWITLME